MSKPAYMETNAAELARLIKDGAIFIRRAADNPEAPTGTDWQPTAADGKIGYYGDNGFTLHPEPGDTTTFTGHNGDDLISDQAPGFWTVAFQGLEANEANAEAYFDVEVAEDGSVTLTSAAANTEWDIVTVGLDQADRLIVVHYPRVKVNAREDIAFNRTTLLAYGMTFRTFKGRADAPYHVKAWGFVPEPQDDGDIEATGATAGEPGTWTPEGATPPANLTALQGGGVTASPATEWNEGEYVVLGDDSKAHWTGAAWAAGEGVGV